MSGAGKMFFETIDFYRNLEAAVFRFRLKPIGKSLSKKSICHGVVSMLIDESFGWISGISVSMTLNTEFIGEVDDC
jgi:hypothetical protein